MVTFNKQYANGLSQHAVVAERQAASSVNHLVSKWHDGDQLAAQEIYDRYADRVDSVVRWHLNPRFRLRVGTEDMVQSVFLDVFDQLRRDRIEFSTDASFTNWIRRIARNKVIKRVSYENAEKRTPAKEQRETTEFRLDGIVDEGGTTAAGRALDGVIRAEKWRFALAQLSPTCRTIVEMLGDGRSQIEIADHLKITTRTVRRKMQLIRGTLKTILL